MAQKINFVVVVIVLMLAAAVGLYSFVPARVDSSNMVQMEAFPMSIGAWKGQDIPLSQRDYDILETKNLIMRVYRDPAGRELMLYLVYSGDNRKVLHPPEVCYLGGGATITEKGYIMLGDDIPANKMIVELSGGRQFVSYWYKAGNFSTNKYFDQQLRVMAGRLLGKKTSSAMIRISADIKDGNDAAVASMVNQFARDVDPLLVKYVP